MRERPPTEVAFLADRLAELLDNLALVAGIFFSNLPGLILAVEWSRARFSGLVALVSRSWLVPIGSVSPIRIVSRRCPVSASDFQPAR